MGQILHPSATTTHATRAAIQKSEKTLAAIAKEYGINRKTARKWKNRSTVEDSAMGTKQKMSTVLSLSEEEFLVNFKLKTGFSLDDILIALKEEMPHLTRSNLYRCLKRHGVSKAVEDEKKKREKKIFKEYEIGYLHIDTAEVRSAESKGYVFVAIDRTSKLAFAKIYKNKSKESSCDFLKYVLERIPYKVFIVLTDNGTEYTDIARNKAQEIKAHPFDRLCQKHKIEHRLTKVKHPWTNGQVERMNRTIKDATIKRYHYETLEQIQEHLQSYLLAYNVAKKLKVLNGKSPIDFLIDKLKLFHYNFKHKPFQYFPEQYI